MYRSAAGGWYAPLREGGQTAPTVVAPDVQVQPVPGQPWASVGVLLSPHGMDEP